MSKNFTKGLASIALVVIGAMLISYGAWTLYPAAGYIAGGFACLGIQHWLGNQEGGTG